MKGSRPSLPLAAAHPATGGSAPGTAPTAWQIHDTRFSGVYANK